MVNRYRFDLILIVCIYTCISIGIFTLYSQGILSEGNSQERWFRQLIYAGIGTLFVFVLSRINYQSLASYSLHIYSFGLLLLLLTLIPGIGREVNGARSWIYIGDIIGFQTSEFAKIGTLVLLANYLTIKERDMNRFSSLIIPFFITTVPILLIVIQPDFGSAFCLLPILLSILVLAGADLLHIGAIVVFSGLSITIPLYIDYHNITLVPALLHHLEDIGKIDLLPVVRILKTEIWPFIYEADIPTRVTGQDRLYLTRVLQNENLMSILQDSVDTVRYEGGGILLRFLEKTKVLSIISLFILFIALILIIIRLARGINFSFLRKFYIPLGILGISLISGITIHSFFTFRQHQVARITAFIQPEKFPRDLAYQIRASKAAIGSGQFSGRGFWKGEMTIGERSLVPEAYTDFIFTSWSERTGFIGAVILLILLLAIPMRALLLSSEARDRFGSLLAGGISFLFFFHISLNIGISLGLLPVTGLPLTFVSYGGSHMIMSMAAVGILLSIYQRKFAH